MYNPTAKFTLCAAVHCNNYVLLSQNPNGTSGLVSRHISANHGTREFLTKSAKTTEIMIIKYD